MPFALAAGEHTGPGRTGAGTGAGGGTGMIGGAITIFDGSGTGRTTGTTGASRTAGGGATMTKGTHDVPICSKPLVQVQ